jgi:hypothetical protein
MTALLEDGPQYEVESKAGKAVEELESIPPPGYTLRTKWYNACECNECDPYGLKRKSRTAGEAALHPPVDVSLDRLTDQRITEEPSEIVDEAPDSADDGPEVDIIRKARR